MKPSRIIFFLVVLLVPQLVAAQRKALAEKAWGPFFGTFRSALKRRDREALKKMMVREFYFSAGGGDDNHDGDSRDEAFEFWDQPYTQGWKAFEGVLGRGAVDMAAWWNDGRKGKYIGRVAPPAANVRRNIKPAAVPWYAIFEFRNGQWYCTIFNQCCN